jgi:Ca2+-binding EF-hand superfamily protein
MTNDEKKRLSRIFSDLDEDNDGILNFEELIQAFIKTGRTPARYIPINRRSFELTSKLLKELELENSSGIDYQQFLVTCCNKEKVLNEKALRASFDLWDIEEKGTISLDDIKMVGLNH